MIYGDPIILGGGPAQAAIVGVSVGLVNASGYETIWDGTGPLTDPEYFSATSAGFTCVRAGTYTITAAIKGNYNTSGNRIDGTIRVQHNGTSVISKLSNSTSYSVGTATVTCEVGDVLSVMGRNNTSSSNLTPCYVIITTG